IDLLLEHRRVQQPDVYVAVELEVVHGGGNSLFGDEIGRASCRERVEPADVDILDLGDVHGVEHRVRDEHEPGTGVSVPGPGNEHDHKRHSVGDPEVFHPDRIDLLLEHRRVQQPDVYVAVELELVHGGGNSLFGD